MADIKFEVAGTISCDCELEGILSQARVHKIQEFTISFTPLIDHSLWWFPAEATI